MSQSDEAKRLFDQGIDAYRAGEYEEALEVLAKARDQFVETGNQTGQAEALGSLGVIYVQLEDWGNAEQTLNEALALCIESQDRSNQAKALGNLGMMCERQGDEEKAAEAYEQSIAIFHELGDQTNEKAVARRLSGLKLKKGKFLDAIGDYQEGLEDDAEANAVQRMARRLFRFFGGLAGGGPVEEGEEVTAEDSAEEPPQPAEE